MVYIPPKTSLNMALTSPLARKAFPSTSISRVPPQKEKEPRGLRSSKSTTTLSASPKLLRRRQTVHDLKPSMNACDARPDDAYPQGSLSPFIERVHIEAEKGSPPLEKAPQLDLDTPRLGDSSPHTPDLNGSHGVLDNNNHADRIWGRVPITIRNIGVGIYKPEDFCIPVIRPYPNSGASQDGQVHHLNISTCWRGLSLVDAQQLFLIQSIFHHVLQTLAAEDVEIQCQEARSQYLRGDGINIGGWRTGVKKLYIAFDRELLLTQVIRDLFQNSSDATSDQSKGRLLRLYLKSIDCFMESNLEGSKDTFLGLRVLCDQLCLKTGPMVEAKRVPDEITFEGLSDMLYEGQELLIIPRYITHGVFCTGRSFTHVDYGIESHLSSFWWDETVKGFRGQVPIDFNIRQGTLPSEKSPIEGNFRILRLVVRATLAETSLGDGPLPITFEKTTQACLTFKVISKLSQVPLRASDIRTSPQKMIPDETSHKSPRNGNEDGENPSQLKNSDEPRENRNQCGGISMRGNTREYIATDLQKDSQKSQALKLAFNHALLAEEHEKSAQRHREAEHYYLKTSSSGQHMDFETRITGSYAEKGLGHLSRGKRETPERTKWPTAHQNSIGLSHSPKSRNSTSGRKRMETVRGRRRYKILPHDDDAKFKRLENFKRLDDTSGSDSIIVDAQNKTKSSNLTYGNERQLPWHWTSPHRLSPPKQEVAQQSTNTSSEASTNTVGKSSCRQSSEGEMPEGQTQSLQEGALTRNGVLRGKENPRPSPSSCSELSLQSQCGITSRTSAVGTVKTQKDEEVGLARLSLDEQYNLEQAIIRSQEEEMKRKMGPKYFENLENVFVECSTSASVSVAGSDIDKSANEDTVLSEIEYDCKAIASHRGQNTSDHAAGVTK